MGRKHNIKQFSFILERLTRDDSLLDIYLDDTYSGMTNAKYRVWLSNLKTRIKKIYKKRLVDFIPIWTKNNRNFVDNSNRFYNLFIMKNKTKNIEIIDKILGSLQINNDTLTFDFKKLNSIINDLEIDKFEINKLKTKLVIKLINKYHYKNKRQLLQKLNISKSTYYRNVKLLESDNDYQRKIRSDSKVNDFKYQTIVQEMVKKHKYRIGIDKVTACVNKLHSNLTLSVATCWRIFKHLDIYTNPGLSWTKINKYKEWKDTKHSRMNLLNNDLIKNSKPLSIQSTDYCVIKHNTYNHLHILGSIDPKTHMITYLKLSDRQGKKDVLEMLKNLNGNISILHSDNGAEFTSLDVKKFCEDNNIKQSFSLPGKSTDNLWIEYFWGRFRIEFANHLNFENLSIQRIKQLLDEYKNYWNYERPIKKFNYSPPNEIVEKYNNKFII